MMRILAAVVLAILCDLSHAAAPSVTCTPSRTSGAAPLSVFLDCSGTTGVTIHTGLFVHNFGDTGAGNWSYGANTGLSKNGATGMFAAHTYETAGSYTITTRVCNSSNECTTSRANTITVTAANTQWSTTKTICVSTSGTFTGCPSGATQVTSSNATTAVSSNISTGDRRILFRGGETFTAATAITLNQATGYLGSFGTGKALITSTGSAVNVSANDWRIVDLDISGYSGSGNAAITTGGNVTKLTVLRLNAHDAAGYGLNMDPGSNTLAELFVVDSTFSALSDGASGYGMYLGATQLAVMGNSVSGVTSHGIRIPRVNKAVIASNTVGTTGLNTIKLHAPDFGVASEYSQNVIMADNKLSGATASINLEIGPQQTTNDERIKNVVVERNWFSATGSAQQYAASLQADLLTVRNNLVDLSNGAAAGNTGFSLIGVNTTPASSNTAFTNNTFYSSAAIPNLTFIQIASNVGSGITTTNNIGYAPVATSPVMVSDTGAKSTDTTNTGDIGALTTNPFGATPSTPSTFRVTTASYAATGGTAIFPASNDDFFNCDDVTANEHIGAMVPRARATCRGVKP